jgi:DNA repair ATPase RecN
MVLGYADRIRGLQPADLAQEIGRLGDGADSAAKLVQLTIALMQSKVPANTLRAQALLQRLLGQNEQDARALQPLARLLAMQLAEARRAEEQLERQTQQLRDAQRRIDQLNERLEAVRAIERSLPARPASGTSAPAAPRP